MYLLPIFLLLLATNPAAQTDAAGEAHLREAGCNVIFLRSAFAHGYRHGYEEGYHLGNIDISLGRHPRTRPSQFRKLSSGYATGFGPKKLFEAGFQDGLKVGYTDGYLGQKFRAVESLRLISVALDQDPIPADPANLYFDQGVSTGYTQGLDRARRERSAAGKGDIASVDCVAVHPAGQQDLAAQGSFCDGYRRGYLLGHADGVVLSPEAGDLAARK
jgi:hypothetical protein